jgi:hypothetical protein
MLPDRANDEKPPGNPSFSHLLPKKSEKLIRV